MFIYLFTLCISLNTISYSEIKEYFYNQSYFISETAIYNKDFKKIITITDLKNSKSNDTF
jgi:hypothetical protein